ncbi:uncharacterized protein involved in exopolysaccharide biosynthesis [Rhodoblastus sphagnicola]|nr:GumC family protein [Rhodoblastus sphagnicola]MBB4198069.1 uncharacterized protein involved in exopolysaccharide biosynthesis [Rhodoblastus sphagnicola]
MSAGIPDDGAPGGRDEVDLGGTLAALARRKGLIIGATTGCAVAALAFCLVVKPRYLAEARVIVEDQESYYTRADPSPREAPQLIDAEAINSQIQLVSSRDLARKAVSALQLQKHPEFDPTVSGLSAVLTLLAGGGGAAAAAEDRLLTSYFDHLTVMSPTKSRILQIEFTSRNPDLAAQAANTVADLYIDLKQQAKREDARQAAQNLKPLIADLQQRVSEADARVADFRVTSGLYESNENRSLPTQQLGEIATRLADASAAQSEARAKARALRDLLLRGHLGDAGEIANNDLVRTLAARRAADQAELAADSRTLMPGHPKIKELQARLSNLEMQLRAAVDKAARGLENDARVAASRVANLSALLDEQKKMVGVANGEETKLKDLQRQAKTLKDQLETESAKYQAALAREKSENTPADARVVSRALSPSLPVFPKKIPITLFSAVAGLFFSSFYVIAREVSGTSRNAPLSPAPTPAPLAGATRFGRRPPRDTATAAAMAPTGARAQADATPRAQGDAPEPRRGFLGRLKTALMEFGAPAVELDEPSAPEKLRQAFAAKPADDIWVRDPFAQSAPAPQATGQATAEVTAEVTAQAMPQAAFQIAPHVANQSGAQAQAAPLQRAQPEVSRELIGRVVAAGDAHGVTALLADATAGAAPLYALVTARALSREGRAILVQAGPDRRLDAALAVGPDSPSTDGSLFDRDQPSQEQWGQEQWGQRRQDREQPGLLQLLTGDSSYAEAIYRDGLSRLHLLASGGRLDADAEDLRMVIDVLRATYDFVLLAVGADTLGLELAREADAVVILGPASARRDALRDDFAAAGARDLILAAPDRDGQLTDSAIG